MRLLYRLLILLFYFATSTSFFLQTRVYALSPEKAKEAEDYAKKLSEEALKKARESGAYDYNVPQIIGVIIRTIIFFIFFIVFYNIYKNHFWKYRIARILYIPIFSLVSLLGFALVIILGFL